MSVWAKFWLLICFCAFFAEIVEPSSNFVRASGFDSSSGAENNIFASHPETDSCDRAEFSCNQNRSSKNPVNASKEGPSHFAEAEQKNIQIIYPVIEKHISNYFIPHFSTVTFTALRPPASALI